jgi:hypothetical protein
MKCDNLDSDFGIGVWVPIAIGMRWRCEDRGIVSALVGCFHQQVPLFVVEWLVEA